MPPTNEPPASLLRTFRFPLIVLVIFGGIFAAPWICDALGLETEEAIPFFMMTMWLSPMVTLLILAVWWLFFSGLGWLARLGVPLLVVAAASAGFILSIRNIELTMSPVGLVPRIHFKWERTLDERLADYLEREGTQTGELAPIDLRVGPDDFPVYRGAKLDGVVASAKLQTDWGKSPPKVLWKHPSIGGYSGIAVAGNAAVTLEQRGAQEAVVCYDRATGRQRWVFAYDAYHKDVMGDGPRATPAIHDNHVYTIGALGDLVCLDSLGKKRWSVNILELAKAKNIQWGMTGSPLIVDDLVIANPGVDPKAPVGPSLIAFEQATGKIRWQTGKRRAGYSSPQLVTLAGVRQLLLFDGEGLISHDPKTGAELWNSPWITDYDMNSIQPVVVGSDRVFISSELNNGAAMLRVTPPDNASAKWSVETVWKNKNLAARYANPVTDGKHLFGLHNMPGVLICLDADDGKIKWKGDRFGPGQILLTEGVLLIVSGDKGDLALVEASGTAYKELARQTLLNDKTWNTPALAGDQLFVRNQAEIVSLKLPMR